MARSKFSVERLGIAVRAAPFELIRSGVSSIHSAVSCVEGYGTVWEKVCPVVTSCNVIVHTFEPVAASTMEACMWSPAWIVMVSIGTLGAGISSHHAE